MLLSASFGSSPVVTTSVLYWFKISTNVLISFLSRTCIENIAISLSFFALPSFSLSLSMTIKHLLRDLLVAYIGMCFYNVVCTCGRRSCPMVAAAAHFAVHLSRQPVEWISHISHVSWQCRIILKTAPDSSQVSRHKRNRPSYLSSSNSFPSRRGVSAGTALAVGRCEAETALRRKTFSWIAQNNGRYGLWMICVCVCAEIRNLLEPKRSPTSWRWACWKDKASKW